MTRSLTTMRPRSDLRSYQERVITHLYDRDAAMAVLKMGAGKTACALTAIQELIRDGEIRHALVIAPKRVASLVWPDEAKQWTHLAGLKLKCLEGGPDARMRTLKDYASRDVTVVGVDNVQWLCEALSLLPDDHYPLFDLLVIDETSRFKDPGSKRGKALAKQAKRFRNRWGLTGTPRPNSLMDLWGPMRLIEPEMWPGSFYGWRQKHFRPLDFKGYRWQPIHPSVEEQLMADAGSIATTLGENEMPDLPELSILVDEITMPPDAIAKYRDMEKRLFTRTPGRTIVATSAAVATGKLAQIANGFVYDSPSGEATPVHDAKRDWLDELLQDLGTEPAIIVYEFLPDRDMIVELLPDAAIIGGGVSEAAAAEAVEDWNARRIQHLVMHPASGGHGLNLQHGGSRMIWLSPTWSAELWDQTLARLHRPGQGQHVMVHVACATGTVDHMKRRRVIGKLSEQAAFEEYLREAAPREDAA
jgi:SNF2 family DNA or RNA helicase